MKKVRRITETAHFLSGSKEIANYLGKSVRTVQRYEWELGLPVRRPAGKARGSVVATRAELDAWVAASPIRWEFKLLRPMPELSNSARLTLASGVKEMVRLRTQMHELRDELHRSVASLHGSIATLGLGRVKLDVIEPLPRADGTARSRGVLEFFDDGTPRKAS